MSAKRKAKFRVGQIVVRKKDDFPIKIQWIDFRMYGQTGQEKWRYCGQGMLAWEHQLRLQTRREKGDAR